MPTTIFNTAMEYQIRDTPYDGDCTTTLSTISLDR